jgi:hypothetical protein
MRFSMSHDKKRLIDMLEEKKISKSEYKTLVKALDKSLNPKKVLCLLINPFEKIAGSNALILGMLMLLVMSYLGALGKLYFLGALSLKVLPGPQAESLGFPALLYQNLVNWALLSTAFLCVAKFIHKQTVRSIDFFGTVAFAHYPYLFLSGFLCALQFWDPSLFEFKPHQIVSLSPEMILLTFIALAAFIWQIAVYFYAFKESSGLAEKKLRTSFFLALTLTEVLAYPLVSIVMH